MPNRVRIETKRLRALINDFERLESGETVAAAKERLTERLHIATQEVELAVPVGEGDYRRPAGSLKSTVGDSVESEGDFWTGQVSVGYEDDRLPYAQWVRWKNVNKGKPDYMQPAQDMLDDIDDIVATAFTDVFHDAESKE